VTALVIALVGALVLAAFLFIRWRTAARAEFIRHYTLPKGLFARLQKRRPELGTKECQLVATALRQFFLAYLHGGRRFVAMPSQVVDDLWHELILYTRAYEAFCGKAFGRFLHHTPAAVLGPSRDANTGLRRCWWYACREDGIDPRKPTRLPLLFAIDAKLGIADGFHYLPDCSGVRRKGDDSGGSTPYCGGDFSSDCFDGSTDGFGDGGSDGGSGGCGGGCGGD
jgi:hypothetical protein